MTEPLGPLELVGDRWVIGDPYRREGACLVLTADGMEHHKLAASEPLAVIPWSRFVDGPSVWATARAWSATRTAGVLLDTLATRTVAGPRACSVLAYLRHPYEDVLITYTHHERRYPFLHISLLDILLRKTTEAKAAHRLGDPAWLGEAVARVAAIRSGRRPERAVAEIIADLNS
ncbi:hypothetical protein FHX37_3673 [Haloactinospora alba]|uniref:Uncharacterized protein n=1 Tax=Haloactinospora alba TaxID=405555 RepID=A0A543N941_9ACTN|nr:hypothetical protein [Haloactinospora alba]TQN28337.1 hypothetical protein FHX37_3673 [Haloactinospora alba]